MSNSVFPPEVRFNFPLANRGIALGNGTLMLEVGGDETLCVTIGRAGIENGPEKQIKRALDADELLEQLASWRPQTRSANGAILELDFGGAARPLAAILRADGIARIELSDGRAVTIECAMDEELAWIDGASGATWLLRSSGEADDTRAPLEIQMDDGRGLVRQLDDDQSVVTMVRERENRLLLATARGETEDAARAAVSRARRKPDINPIYYWKQFWRSAPRVIWPDARLQRQWDIALFERAQASATTGATIDFLAAFSRLLAQSHDDGVRVVPVIPPGWRELSFDEIRCDNFIVGASVERGALVEVRVRSENDEVLRLYPGAHDEIERAMSAGESWIWRA